MSASGVFTTEVGADEVVTGASDSVALDAG
jgi:hypothetical protein